MKISAIGQSLVRNRVYVFVGLFVVAALITKARSELEVVERNSLLSRDVALRYVGNLEKVVSRSGLNHGSTHFQGGQGIGIENDKERNEVLRKLRPVLYIPFSDILALTEAELESVAQGGPEVNVLLLHGEVLAVSNTTREIIPYERYALKVRQKRERLFWAALATISLALGFLAVASLKVRRLDSAV